MFRIVASDLDGTLLNANHQFSSYTKQILQSLKKQDVHFVFATGRHHVDVAQMRENMAIDAFMITSNGARVHDHQGKLIFSQNLDPDIAKSIAQIVKDDPLIYTHLYQGDHWLINKEDPYSLTFYDEAFRYQLFEPTNFDPNNIAKIYFTTNSEHLHDHLVALKNTLQLRYGSSINVAFSTLNCLEVMGNNVSKGNALQHVATTLGYTLQDSIAFGDGMNDLDMLLMAGRGCIMQNASEELKKQLPNLEVIGSNLDEAVPHYLNQLFFNHKPS